MPTIQNMQKKQLFFSHNWGDDNISRDNHKRVKLIKNILCNSFGWTTWFDEDNMGWNIDGSMFKGIYECDVVLVFITSRYLNKIEENCLNPQNRDNCAKEWNLINMTKQKIIPIIMEEELMSTSNWSHNLLGMYLGSHMFIDLSKEININSVFKLHDWIMKNFNLTPVNSKKILCARQLLQNKSKEQMLLTRTNRSKRRSKSLLDNNNNIKKLWSDNKVPVTIIRL